MVFISIWTTLSTCSIVCSVIQNVDRSTTKAWTGHHHNSIIPFSRCPVKTHLYRKFWLLQYQLDWTSVSYLGTLYCRVVFNYVHFMLINITQQMHVNFEQVCFADLGSQPTFTKLKMGDWWQVIQNQFPARVTIVPGIGVSDKHHLTIFVVDHYAWVLYLTFHNIQIDIHYTPKWCAWILVGMILCPPTSAMNTDNEWHNVTRTVLSPVWLLHIMCPGCKWNCVDGVYRQYYPWLTALVGDYPE